ncbi:MAG TPA: hypothetical protein VK717_11305 [Opitutaceae bacterium]|jgi:hypothetical protein|nr:hypothetical protein [Opitutaceae bacterium]
MKEPASNNGTGKGGFATRLVVFLLAAIFPLAVVHATQEDDLKASLQDSLAAVQNVRSAIDASDFDLDARAQGFNKDVAATFEFVHNGIAFEPYAGVMRGAQGCLVSEAGNAADKALLLSELLRREGFKTRLAFGTLSDQTAAQLADEYLRWELDESPRTLDLPYTPDDPSVAQQKSDATAALRQHLLQRQQTLTAAVLKALGDRASQAAGGVSIKSFLPDIKSHVWVQVEQDGKYVDLDPCFFDADPGASFCPADSTADTVPDDAWRQVGFRVFIEKYDGQGVTESTLFESQQKSADLTGVPVMISVSRTKAQFGGLANGLSAAFGEAPSGDTHMISLAVNGKQLQSATFTCIPPQKAGGGGGLFGMGGGGDGKNGPFVTAVGVEVSFSGPDEHRAPIRRYLLDLWGLAARAAKDTGPLENLNVDAAALAPLDLEEFCFAVEGGTVCPAQIQARLLDTSIANLRAITVANGLVSMAAPAADDSAHNITDTYFHYFDSMASELFERQGFSAGPRVLLAVFDQTGSFKFDVTSDPQRIVTELSLQPFKDQLTTGLLAAIVEEELVTDPAKPDNAGGANQGCASLLEASLAQGPPTVVAAGAEIPGTASPDGRMLMQSALDAGRLLILPAGAASGWFELDPATGAIEAVWQTGLHQDSTETAELEKDDAKKASLASKWRRTIKKLLECATDNADTLAMAIIDAHGPGLTYDDAIGLIGAAKDCIAAIRKAHAEARALSNSRKGGVSRAWKQEKDLVEKGKGTRPWKADEVEKLKKEGKVAGYEGHHINSVKKNPGLAGDPNNIKFVNREEHMAEHGGNFGNPTHGDPIDRINGQPPGTFYDVPVTWLQRGGLSPNGTYGEAHRYFRLQLDGADWVPVQRPCSPEFSRPRADPGARFFDSGLAAHAPTGTDVYS